MLAGILSAAHTVAAAPWQVLVVAAAVAPACAALRWSAAGAAAVAVLWVLAACGSALVVVPGVRMTVAHRALQTAAASALAAAAAAWL